MTYVHPKLGKLFPEDTGWLTEEVHVPFCSNRIGVCLAGCPDDGPSPAALSGYAWIESNWPLVLERIQEQAFAFYAPYADSFQSIPKFSTPAALWGTEEILFVRVFSKNDFEITLRFTWQEPEDRHEITFYVEDVRCETHSVDG